MLDVAVVATRGEPTLLDELRGTLDGAESALLCVSSASQGGVHLIERQLSRLRSKTRLVVAGGFSTAGLADAHRFGAEIRVLDARRGVFHPKLFLARLPAAQDGAVVGSADLTSGIISNHEVGTRLRGDRAERALESAWALGEDFWRLAQPWTPTPSTAETFDPALLAQIQAEVQRDPTFLTLARQQPNVVTDVTATGLLVRTDASEEKGNTPQPVPAWMFMLAWDYLRAHGEITNDYLLNTLHVHRSSAVCAILARLPGIESVLGRTITLRRET